MDNFQAIIRTLLEADHFWVQSSFKVDLRLEEKRQLEKPKIPRPEIDLLALNFEQNEVLVVEAKSFVDSPGMRVEELAEEQDIPAGRYKLFTSKRYRTIVFNRLLLQLCEYGMASADTKISLVLAAGNVYKNQSAAIQELFLTKGFIFWSPEEITEKVTALAKRGYQDDAAIITAKILLK
jgi:predicted transcriptional regulator